MTLTEEDFEALAWLSAAVHGADYAEGDVKRMVAMSFSRYRNLPYILDDSSAPQNMDTVDVQANLTFLPENAAERAWGVRSVTHQKLKLEIDQSCSEYARITADGKIHVSTKP